VTTIVQYFCPRRSKPSSRPFLCPRHIYRGCITPSSSQKLQDLFTGHLCLGLSLTSLQTARNPRQPLPGSAVPAVLFIQLWICKVPRGKILLNLAQISTQSLELALMRPFLKQQQYSKTVSLSQGSEAAWTSHFSLRILYIAVYMPVFPQLLLH
jgi:hypothetical protein